MRDISSHHPRTEDEAREHPFRICPFEDQREAKHRGPGRGNEVVIVSSDFERSDERKTKGERNNQRQGCFDRLGDKLTEVPPHPNGDDDKAKQERRDFYVAPLGNQQLIRNREWERSLGKQEALAVHGASDDERNDHQNHQMLLNVMNARQRLRSARVRTDPVNMVTEDCLNAHAA